MLKLAVIGKDVSKSLSPRMHSFLLRGMGCGCVYDAISIPPPLTSERAEPLFDRYDGINVTIPFKADVLPYLNRTEGDAALLGAVNTVLTKERTGYNTDGYGFMLMLRNAGVAVTERRALVLGAGGAGRSVIHALSKAGAEVFAYSRNRERLSAFADDIGGFTPLPAVPGGKYDLIVNCTGIGMHESMGNLPAIASEVSLEELLSCAETAVDLIYEPKQSEFLRVAASCGKRTVNGAAMLFYQAYGADCIYLRREPSAEQAERLWKKYQEEEK